MRLFAGEDVQLLTEDEDLDVFVIAGKVGDAEEIDEGGAQLGQKRDEHASIVISRYADGKLESTMGGVQHVF